MFQNLSRKKKDIYAQLKSDIKSKAKSIKLDSEKNLDKLISNVDEKIQTGLNYER